MSAEFKDHFSQQSSSYGQFRPTYPTELFEHLATISPGRQCAWDCATGTGQAAVALADYFEHVIATDASAAQINAVQPHDRIDYQTAPAEKTTITEASIDLITVAQALHWFDIAAFENEVRRVLKPEGILAVWTYNLFAINAAIDDIIQHFYHDTLGPYWPDDRTHVENAYHDISFTLTECNTPNFAIQANWNLQHLLGYLGTWSALKAFRKNNDVDPLPDLEKELLQCWTDPERRLNVSWPLTLRVFKQ